MAQITNQAQLSYGTSIINSNIAVGEILESLSVTKSSIAGAYSAGDSITYVISIINSGTSAVTDVSVSDNLGAYTFGTNTLYPLNYYPNSVKAYVNGVLQTTAPTVSSGPPLVFSGITVPASGNYMIIYDAYVTQYAPLDSGSTINNTATVTGTGVESPLTAAAAVPADGVANLSITKSISPTTVTENSTVTYTFTIQNYGNTAALESDAVVLSDTFNPVLSGISVTINGTAAALTDYTYNTSTGLFETTAGVITVPAATYSQDSTTGAYITTPGTTTVTVSGTV